MSAFVVSKKHIDVVATMALEGNLIETSHDAATAFGKLLWAENVASIAYRYNLPKYGKEVKAYHHAIATYEFKREDVSRPQRKMALECYDYQSCEHDGWKLSAARFAVVALDAQFADMADHEHSYEIAGWGFADA